MELLFVCLIGAIVGLSVRYTLPQRHRHGSVLVPAVGTAMAAVAWVALTWAGMKWNAGWIWAITIILTIAVTVVVDLLLGWRRQRSDDRMLATLSKGTIRL